MCVGNKTLSRAISGRKNRQKILAALENRKDFLFTERGVVWYTKIREVYLLPVEKQSFL